MPVDLSLYNALHEQLKPRDACESTDDDTRYHPADRDPRLAGKVLMGGGGFPLYLDHREDWAHPSVRGTGLMTWHIHGALVDGQARIPTFANDESNPFGHGCGGWFGPSWYWPGCLVGMLWAPSLEGVMSRLAEFAVLRVR